MDEIHSMCETCNNWKANADMQPKRKTKGPDA